MKRIKVEKNKGYTTISNVFLRDKNLSLKAKGFLAMIMSLKDDWDFSIEGFVKITKEGEAAIYSAIKELKKFGYCKEEKVRNEKKRIIGNEYTFYELPLDCENQDLGFQNQENQPQQNIDNNKVLNQKKNESDKSLSKSDKKNDLFDECWIAYNRKGSKKKAKDQWCKLTDKEKECVMQHIKVYVTTRDKKFQKDFERYLRDKTFNDLIIQGNNVVFDPSNETDNTYHPITGGALMWNDYYKCYLYTGWYFDGDKMYDGYEDDKRPDGAEIVLNNGRGTLMWNKQQQKWIKK